MREHTNPYDKFAVAGKTLLKRQIGLILVGHVPRELSCYLICHSRGSKN